MTADPFVCLSCGYTCSHRRCIWVYRLGPGNSGFACPECYSLKLREETMISQSTLACALSALKVAHDSLNEPSVHFSREIQRKHQAEIRDAIAELEAQWPQMPEEIKRNETVGF